MQKPKHSLIVLLNLALFTAVSLFATDIFPKVVTGTSPSYTVSLTSSDPASISASDYASGTKTVKSIIFNYVNAINVSSYHTQLRAADGSIANASTTQITSILSVNAVYTSTTSMILTTGTSANPTTNSVTIASGVETAVSGYPYFFKLLAGSNVVYFTSLTITYSCVPIGSSSSSSLASSETSIVYAINVKTPYTAANDNTAIASLIQTTPSNYFTFSGIAVSSVVASSLFANATNNAIRVSSSSAGSLRFNFTAAIMTTSVVLTVSRYVSDTSLITVSNGVNSATGTVTSGTTSLTFPLNATATSTQLTISSSSKNRFYLSSVSITAGSGASSSSSSSSSLSSISSSSAAVTYDNFYKQTAASTAIYSDLSRQSECYSLPSTGTQKILVIPVIITGYPFTAQNLTDIATTFAGDATQTGWQSLKSFYATSSFGNLSLDITVSSPYTSNYTPSQVLALNNTSYGDLGTYTVLQNAVAWYKTTTATTMTGFDQDANGFIDNVWMVYSCPNYSNSTAIDGITTGDNPFWAFTFWDFQTTANTANPAPCNYAWASYDFMYEGYGTSLLDAHTYIHETGHVLGLDDYYNYDSTGSGFGPTGQIDMMDYNIVDHNTFSKVALGWTKPYIVTGNADITINPSQTAGECILIPRVGKTFAGHPFDEYIMLELYTPTGLNLKDSLSKYAGTYPLAYTVPGIKLYHIDARLVNNTYSGSAWIAGAYTTILGASTSTSYYSVGNSNTPTSSKTAAYSLAHLIEAGGINTFKNGEPGTNTTLFKTGNTFSLASFGTNFFPQTTLMNDGTAFGYTISFTSVTATSATIRISVI